MLKKRNIPIGSFIQKLLANPKVEKALWWAAEWAGRKLWRWGVKKYREKYPKKTDETTF